MSIKAYKAFEVDGYYSTIVFAESAGKAKAIAMDSDCLEGIEWVNIRVKREPMADFLYNGYSEIDWDDDGTRLILVRDMGWSCLEAGDECNRCVAKEYCRIPEEE